MTWSISSGVQMKGGITYTSLPKGRSHSPCSIAVTVAIVMIVVIAADVVAEVVQAGVVTEIGVSVVRPAEFVVFRVSQWAGPGE